MGLSLPHSTIAREKTALSRRGLSRPIRLALDSELISPEGEVLDYGCGRGDDIRLLKEAGIRACGWDPVHRPEGERCRAPVVNLGYVVNVIEDQEERRSTLSQAWDLAERVLIVSARLSEEARFLSSSEEFEDGVLTSAGTFQKFFGQDELRTWIDGCINATSIAAAPGIYFVFRDKALEQTYLASRFRKRSTTPRPRLSNALYEKHQSVLVPLMDFFTERGRLPEPMELPEIETLCREFGSIKRAFTVVRRVTGSEQWERIRDQRRDDLLIYLALTRFSGRPRLSELPSDLRRDIRAFGPKYTNICEEADALLFSAGNMDKIKSTARSSSIGKIMPKALYVHVSALESLPTPLRIYEGCARSYVGVVERANLIKLHLDAPAVTYLAYPTFDTVPHPELVGSLLVRLNGKKIQYRDYSTSASPPLLHRKELFLSPSHPDYQAMAELTAREEAAGLYREPARIGTRNGWLRALKSVENPDSSSGTQSSTSSNELQAAPPCIQDE